MFHSLKRDHMKQIIDIQATGLHETAGRPPRFRSLLTDAAKDWLVEEGYDPIYGRPPAQADDSAPRPGPAGDPGARRPVRGRRHDNDRRRSGRANVRKAAGGQGIIKVLSMSTPVPPMKPLKPRGKDRRRGAFSRAPAPRCGTAWRCCCSLRWHRRSYLVPAGRTAALQRLQDAGQERRRRAIKIGTELITGTLKAPLPDDAKQTRQFVVTASMIRS